MTLASEARVAQEAAAMEVRGSAGRAVPRVEEVRLAVAREVAGVVAARPVVPRAAAKAAVEMAVPAGPTPGRLTLAAALPTPGLTTPPGAAHGGKGRPTPGLTVRPR